DCASVGDSSGDSRVLWGRERASASAAGADRAEEFGQAIGGESRADGRGAQSDGRETTSRSAAGGHSTSDAVDARYGRTTNGQRTGAGTRDVHAVAQGGW